MRFDQLIWLNGAAIGNAVATATLQASGTLVAVTFKAVLFLTLGAGDEAFNEIELSQNSTILQASNMSPPNAVIAKAIVGACCDIAGTSMQFSYPADRTIGVVPRKLEQGQLLYCHIGSLYSRAGGVGTHAGYVIAHFN